LQRALVERAKDLLHLAEVVEGQQLAEVVEEQQLAELREVAVA